MPDKTTREPALPPEMPLWRYMDIGKLMVLLVNHKVFIPTLTTLRAREDPLAACRT
jgi:hypothetical protein